MQGPSTALRMTAIEGQSRAQDFCGHTDAKSAPGLCRSLVARTFLTPAFPRFVASAFPSSSGQALFPALFLNAPALII